MKKLFEFHLSKKTKETVKESSKNDKGETVTTEKETEKIHDQKVVLRKPNRSLHDEAELFYGVKLSEGIKAGLLTRALLAKRFSNDGGVLSEDDKGRYADLYLKLYETQLDIDRLSLQEEKTDSDDSRLEKLMVESSEIRRELTDFEMAQTQLFEQTAENRARNKTILWWLLNLSYLEDEKGKLSPVFSGDTYEEKLSMYDSMEDSDDEFDENLLQKLIYYVSFWYVGRVTNQEEFEKLIAENEGIEEKVGEAVEEEIRKETEAAKEELKVETNDESQGKKASQAKSKPKKEDKPKELVGANQDVGGGNPKKEG
tara:strand:+ start:4564 stop:5505 length:942 start_codon:yes stop_codon:yes gene_type:complete